VRSPGTHILEFRRTANSRYEPGEHQRSRRKHSSEHNGLCPNRRSGRQCIQAIESTGRRDGRIAVRIHRVDQLEIDGRLPDIQSFDVEDNGMEFTAQNRQSFDTLCSDLKIAAGGKGFGRFIWLKDVQVERYFRGRQNLQTPRVLDGQGNRHHRQ
jgi:hypothetical protein